MRIAFSVVFLSLTLVPLATAQQPSLETVAERSGFTATATSEEVRTLCQALDERSEAVTLTSLGSTTQGKPIPLLIVADPPVTTPQEAGTSGKLVVLLFGNIHAGEVCGKEALLMLVRELTASPGHPLLKDLILAVVPNYNPDGNDQMAQSNRPGQVGPEAGMGRRENGQGLDLNRDFVKLDAPETLGLVRWMDAWNPHLVVDTHTTNGSRHRFTVTHAGPKHPAGDPRVIDYVDERLLPAVTERMDQDHGWKIFPYGNFSRDRDRWFTFACEPRYSTNYVGLRNRIGLLSEAYAYAPYKDRVLATRDFCRAILTHAAAHKAEIAKLLDEAARGGQPGEPVAVRAEPKPRSQPATVLGFLETEREGRRVATDEPAEYRVALWDDFAPSETVPRPAAYLVPARFSRAIQTLRHHGLETRTLREDILLDVEVYRVDEVKRAERAYQGHHLVDLTATARQESRLVTAGTVLVPATGPLGSLAVVLLEPRSHDGLATWNAFDEGLEEGSEFPVLRLPKPPSYPLLLTQERSSETGRTVPANRRPTGGMRGLSPRGGSGFSRWIDAEHFVQVKEGKTLKVHAETGRAEPWEEASEDRGPLTEALSSLPTIGKETARGLAARATLDAKRSGAYVEHDADLYFASLDGRQARRLTSTPGREELVEFSPDGQFVSFVRDNDLHVVDVATGTERALTTGGSDRVRHGKADWVYFEELFNRSWKAYWWSPDSRHIAFLEIDDRHIPTHHVLIDTGDRRVVEETAYPRSGEPNPYVQLGIVPVGGGPVRHADLTGYTPDDFLISDVGWWPDGKHAYFYGQNRIQTWLDVLKLPVAGGKPQRLFRETTRAWVESLGPIHVLKDGTFLISSERDGWKHLYRYNADGSLQNRLTSGEWEVRGISRIDEDGGWVYLTGTRDNPIGLNLYRAKLDGSALERLTQGPGTHSAALSPEGGLLVDQYSGRETPPKAELRRTDGSAVRTLDAGDEASAAGPGDPSTPTREIVRIPTRDGFLLEGEVVLPANLDPSGKTLYPVWLMTYGGPHFPTIRDGWRGPGAGLGLEGTLVERGIIVFKVDPRSASGKGAASAWTAYRKLGVQELEDIKDALAWLKQRPYVDGSRIGLSGHSYGGYLTAFCMTHSDLFAAGIAGAPVTDWRDYDSIYTERYMSTPQDNPEGYKASSVVEAAANLHGKLLILHGAIDDNVSVRNTMRLVHALQQADKDFELMIYPSARHGIGGAHYSRIQRAFIERVIGGPKPKD